MSWIKENKFLAGFTAATVVGAGALGFLLLQAKGKYEEASTGFEEQANELNRLQSLKPFPNAENVKKLDAQKKDYAAAITQLQQSLRKQELPLEQISSQQFQDRLRSTVDSIKQRAGENGVKIAPEASNLGFDRYLSEVPRAEAAPALGRELKAIEMIFGILIKNRVAEIRDMNREEVPEERGSRADADPANKQGKGSKNSKELVSSSAVQVTYVSEQGNLMNTLNEIVSAKEQIFVPRVVDLKNEKETGPTRALAPVAAPAGLPDPNAAPGAAPAVPAAAPVVAAVPAAPAQQIIVGEERVITTARFEIVHFAEPAAPASK